MRVKKDVARADCLAVRFSETRVGRGQGQVGTEDRMLHKELAGYAEYAQKVRHRLLPGVW